MGLRLECLVVLPSLSCGRRLLCLFATVFGGPACARMPAKFLPVILAHIDAVMLGGFLDVGEGQFAVIVGNADRLVETGNSVSHVTRVGHRLFTLLREGEDAVRQVAALG